MTTFSLRGARFSRGLGARAVLVTAAYLGAAATILLTVILTRCAVTPAVLRGLLGFIFMASLAAGLEPATAKAAALAQGGAGAAGPPAYLLAGTLKALVAAPALALLWRFADPAVTLGQLAWTPAITMAGFCATDLRVLLDLRGHYARAILLKQGSLAGGVAIVGALAVLGTPLAVAIGVSCVGRLALLALFLSAAPTGSSLADWSRDTRRLLADRRWPELAAVSVIAAAGGSTDRVFGLRYLGPAAYGGYYLTYELLTKFWLIPYVLAPILFARQAAGQGGRGFLRGAYGLTLAAGGLFVVALAGLLAVAPSLFAQLVGASFGWAVAAFAVAVVSGGLCQLRVAQLQGDGRSRQAMIAVAVSAILSVPIFLVAARDFGPRGLLAAWPLKVAAEMTILFWRPKATRLDIGH